MKTIFKILMIVIALSKINHAEAGRLKNENNTTAKTIEVTYISNCGFLLQIGEKKILFDIEDPEKAFDKQSLFDVYKLLNENKAPFDHITAVFISHAHPDHLGASQLLEFLAKNDNVKLYTNQGVSEELQKIGSQLFTKIEKNVVVVDPYQTGILEMIIEGIKVEFLGLYHAGAPNYIFKDLSFVLSYGGQNIFYMSDIDPGYADNFEVIKKWARQDKKIDLLFSPDVNLYPNQWSEKGAEIIKQYLKPEHIIATHLDPRAIDEAEKKVRENFPGAMVFRKCLDKKTIK